MPVDVVLVRSTSFDNKLEEVDLVKGADVALKELLF